VHAACDTFKLSRKTCRYWKEKSLDPTLHPGKWGGTRNTRFPPVNDKVWSMVVWELVEQRPSATLKDCVQHLRQCGVSVSRSWVYRLLKRLKLTYKVIKYRAAKKYTPENMQYYFTYALAAQNLPLHRLKYCDETHFAAKDTRARRGWGPIGPPLVVVSNNSLRTRITITAVTTLTRPSGTFISDPVKGGNGGLQFLEFVKTLFAQNVLVPGDVFVMDNSSIHFSLAIRDELIGMFDNNGVRLVFLPVYSPELNPCEFVFAQVKNYLRSFESFDSDDHFLVEILRAFARVTKANVLNMYQSCLSMRAV